MSLFEQMKALNAAAQKPALEEAQQLKANTAAQSAARESLIKSLQEVKKKIRQLDHECEDANRWQKKETDPQIIAEWDVELDRINNELERHMIRRTALERELSLRTLPAGNKCRKDAGLKRRPYKQRVQWIDGVSIHDRAREREEERVQALEKRLKRKALRELRNKLPADRKCPKCNDVVLRRKQWVWIKKEKHHICLSCHRGHNAKTRAERRLELIPRNRICPKCGELKPNPRSWAVEDQKAQCLSCTRREKRSRASS